MMCWEFFSQTDRWQLSYKLPTIIIIIFFCRFLEQLGSGQFGQVCKGVWSIAGATKELAIKTLKPGAPEGEKVKLLQEAAIMGQFSHANVVKLYGVVTVGEPVSYIVLV